MKRNAFTLVELLVVLAIILALVAILMPSLNRAVEATQIAVCGSNQSQISNGLLSYASDHFGRLPEGNASSWWTLGNDLSWYQTKSSGGSRLGWASYEARGEGQPVGIPFIVMNGYVTDARLMYCPSTTHPWAQYDKLDENGATNWGKHVTGGWPAPGNAGPKGFRAISYQYRASIGCDPKSIALSLPGGRAPHLARDGAIPISADFWTERYLEWDDYHHRDGFQTLYLDGAVRWVGDPDHEYISGTLLQFSHGQWGTQEKYWLEFFR